MLLHLSVLFTEINSRQNSTGGGGESKGPFLRATVTQQLSLLLTTITFLLPGKKLLAKEM
jgi:hypothetical protein